VKALIALVLAVSASLVAAPSIANDVKVGFVSLDRILKDSAPAVAANKRLEKEFQARGQEIEKLAKQARDLQAVLEKESVTMAESDRRNKEGELGRLNRDLQRLQREFREDLNSRRNEEYQKIIERANKIVQQIAESEKYDLIFQDAVYRSPRIDITEKVLKALAEKEK
jgi:outer membrane protein